MEAIEPASNPAATHSARIHLGIGNTAVLVFLVTIQPELRVFDGGATQATEFRGSYLLYLTCNRVF